MNARLIAVNADTSYSEGSTLAYYLIKEYSPIAYQSDPLEIKIKRYAVINIYN